MKPKKVLLLLVMFLLAGNLFIGCKKIDLVRITDVKTLPVTDIQLTTATANGNIIDLGEGEILDHGFCWSSATLAPTKNDYYLSKGPTSLKGNFSAFIENLSIYAEYNLRSYIEDENGIKYGNSISFTSSLIDGIPSVTTSVISDINSNSATGGGNVLNQGGSEVLVRGVCWSSASEYPTIFDYYTNNGNGNGTFTSQITGLSSNTTYYVRAYATNSIGTGYGGKVIFTTSSGGGTGLWLKYDDGANYTSIGLTDGSNFDYAIRFPTQALTNYDGYRISKIKFFPKEAADFHVEVFEGVNPPTLIYYEDVNNPILNTWNEYIPTYTYYIDSGKEVWIGIWVTNYFAGTYPAGCDDGPAIAGAGDMISFDDGVSWESLYTGNPLVNYNWNLEVFVTNQKGQESKLVNSYEYISKESSLNTKKGSISNVVSEKDVK